MAKVRISGKTSVKVKKHARRMVGGKGDGAFISGKILTTVKKKKASNSENSCCFSFVIFAIRSVCYHWCRYSFSNSRNRYNRFILPTLE